MIRVFALSKEFKKIENITIEDLDNHEISWYWVDFENPTESETSLLSSYFNFHPLSIEDCIVALNRPKLDYCGEYNFIIINALNQETLKPKEVNLFLENKFIVSYHLDKLEEINTAWERVNENKANWHKGPIYAAHQIIDKVVDNFFPAINNIEDLLDKLDNNENKKSIHQIIDEIFQIRSDLLKLRRISISMRDLLYRLLNSERFNEFNGHKLYFSDIYDHLLKLCDMIESSREMTTDMRDSYISINSNKINEKMMLLTVITSIFIPLTFIVGVYGMNFEYMPELKWKFGYFGVLFLMFALALVMFLWFKRKGWFNK